MELLIVVLWLAFCGVAAYIAADKGRSRIGIFFLSFLLSPLVGIIVAVAMNSNPAAQGKKKCPNCAEFVQPDAKTCRFCQHSFIEEEAAQRVRQEELLAAERSRLQVERDAWQAKQEAWQAKPWWKRNLDVLIVITTGAIVMGGMLIFAIFTPPMQNSAASTVSSEVKPTMPQWVAEERSSVPISIWEKKVGWAARHHCFFMAMSRDELVRALGKPAEETTSSLTYKRQTRDCIRYNGDDCVEYKTDENIIFLKDGYEDKEVNNSDKSCRTLYGENRYVGLEVPKSFLEQRST